MKKIAGPWRGARADRDDMAIEKARTYGEESSDSRGIY